MKVGSDNRNYGFPFQKLTYLVSKRCARSVAGDKNCAEWKSIMKHSSDSPVSGLVRNIRLPIHISPWQMVLNRVPNGSFGLLNLNKSWKTSFDILRSFITCSCNVKMNIQSNFETQARSLKKIWLKLVRNYSPSFPRYRKSEIKVNIWDWQQSND